MQVGQFADGSTGNKRRKAIMLSWPITCLIIAIVAGLFGFFGIAGIAANVAQVLFVIFLVLFLVSLLSGRHRRGT
jgi:uncharacterized membrane protein YtjA (UPF0391 family)